jgi:hypothetical protein
MLQGQHRPYKSLSKVAPNGFIINLTRELDANAGAACDLN